MKELAESAKRLRKEIKRKEHEIDNPALVLSILCQLDSFVENIKK